MVRLGKAVKGRTKATEQKQRVIIKIRNQNLTMEELEKQQIIMKMRRDHLKESVAEEGKTASFNRMKILTHWRRIMRVAKTESLKRDIQIYQQNHDREIDAKDAVAQMLLRDINESEEQHQMSLQNHKIRLDQLISIQRFRLKGLSQEFERDLFLLKNEFDIEKSDIEKGHIMEKRELCDMVDTIKEEELGKLDQLQKLFREEREQTKNSKMEELESMKHTLIKKIEALDQDFEVSFSNYVSETEANSTKYTQQLEQNDKDSRKITQYMRAISRIKENISNLILKQHQFKHDCEDRNTKLLREKITILKHYHELKRNMNSFRDDQSQKLSHLAMNSKN